MDYFISKQIISYTKLNKEKKIINNVNESKLILNKITNKIKLKDSELNLFTKRPITTNYIRPLTNNKNIIKNNNSKAINSNAKLINNIPLQSNKIDLIKEQKSLEKNFKKSITNISKSKLNSTKISSKNLRIIKKDTFQEEKTINITENSYNINNTKELIYKNDIHSFKLNKINKTIEFVPKVKEKNLADVLNSKLNSQKIKSPVDKINYFKDEIKIIIESFGCNEKDSFKQKTLNLTFNISNLFKLLNDLHNESKLYLYRNTFARLSFNLGSLKNQFLKQYLYYNLINYDSTGCLYEINTDDYIYKFVRNKFSFASASNNLNNSKVINKFMYDNMPYFIPINNNYKTNINMSDNSNNKYRKLNNSESLNPFSIENFFFKAVFKHDAENNVLVDNCIKLKKVNYMQIINLQQRYNIETKDLECLESLEFIIDKEWNDSDFCLNKIGENSYSLSKYIIGEYNFARDHLVADLRKLKNLGLHVCIEVNSDVIKEDEKNNYILDEKTRELFSLFLNKVYMNVIRGYREKNLEEESNIKLDLRISFYKYYKKEKNNKINNKNNNLIVNANKQILLFARHCFRELSPREKVALCLMRIRKKLVKKINNKDIDYNQDNINDYNNYNMNNFNKVSNKLYNKSYSLLHKNIILKVSEFIDFVKITKAKNIFKSLVK